MHACLGKNLTFECTVHGGNGDSTVWQGTAFSDCEITLLHIRFRQLQGTAGVCNSGAISGRSVRVENNSSYISRLRVAITAEMVGKNIECNRDNGTIIYTIGRYLIKTGISITFFQSIANDILLFLLVSSWPASCGLCILAVQTAVGDYTVKELLNYPVYVPLNQARKCAFNNSEMIIGNNN